MCKIRVSSISIWSYITWRDHDIGYVDIDNRSWNVDYGSRNINYGFRDTNLRDIDYCRWNIDYGSTEYKK